MRRLFMSLAVAGFLATSLWPASAAASHKWNKYHWARVSGETIPMQLDTSAVTGPQWSAHTATVFDNWNAYAAPIFWLSSGAPPQTVTVEHGDYGANGWLGIAEIWPDRAGHIMRARVRFNDYYMNQSAYAGKHLHVYCHEVGHTLALGHNRNGKVGGTPDNTCMNDYDWYETPNSHDTDQLRSIYDHRDKYSTSSVRPASGSGWVKIHSTVAFL